MTDQIITELSRFSDFRLYLPTPEAKHDDSEDPLAASKKLGIPLVVTGTIASDASTLRIGSRLIEVASGRVLWSEEFQRPAAADSLLSTQADIASAIASTLGQPYGVIQSQITNRLPDGDAPTMSSYECVLRAYAYRRTFSDKLRGPVLSCLEGAVERDPKYAEAWAMLGWLYMDEGRFDLAAGDARNEAYDRGLEAASHAVRLDTRNVLALKALASINHYKGNFEEGERLQRQALAINPNDPDTLAQLGWRLAVRGNFVEGIPYLNRAIERTVNPPGWYFHLIAVDHYMHGRYAEMLDCAKRGAVDNSGISWSFVAIAQGALGDKAEAEAALHKMGEIAPRLASDPAAVFRGHGATEAVINALVAGLRNAGWTGQPAG
jgi:hypothetical protein